MDKVKKTTTNNKALDSKQAEIQAKKEGLKVRTKTALMYIIPWMAIYLVFVMLTSGTWFDGINQNVRTAFCFISMVLVVPILFFAIKETCDLCFPKNKKVLIGYTVATFAVYIGLSVILLLSLSKRLNIITPLVDGVYNSFLIWVITLCCGILVLYISAIIMCAVKKSKHTLPDEKSLLIFPFLIFFLTLFGIALFYVSIVHTWTTCLILGLLPILSDALAYFSGMLIGKHKMCPKISPKKTWEGLAGSIILTSLIMCGVYAFWFIPNAEPRFNSLYSFLGCQTCVNPNTSIINLQPYFWAIYVCVTMLFIVTSTLGDLFFSWIKRKFNIKDFSNILPGHGGMLDRIDSSTFVFILYFVVTIILQVAVRKNGINPGIDFLWRL